MLRIVEAAHRRLEIPGLRRLPFRLSLGELREHQAGGKLRKPELLLKIQAVRTGDLAHRVHHRVELGGLGDLREAAAHAGGEAPHILGRRAPASLRLAELVDRDQVHEPRVVDRRGRDIPSLFREIAVERPVDGLRGRIVVQILLHRHAGARQDLLNGLKQRPDPGGGVLFAAHLLLMGAHDLRTAGDRAQPRQVLLYAAGS